MSEIWNKMKSGEWYDASHPELIEKLRKTRELLWEYNMMRPSEAEKKKAMLRGLLGKVGEVFHINQPFRCDYGENIEIGNNFFANFNLTILDEATVRIGDNVFIGPNVSIYTACHPLDTENRNRGIEWAEPVIIGDNVWIGGSVTIVPGVTIGDNAVIAAGSVVVKDVEPNTLVAGNPAIVKKHIDQHHISDAAGGSIKSMEPEFIMPEGWGGRRDFGHLEQLGMDSSEDGFDDYVDAPDSLRGFYEQLGLDSCAD